MRTGPDDARATEGQGRRGTIPPHSAIDVVVTAVMLVAGQLEPEEGPCALALAECLQASERSIAIVSSLMECALRALLVSACGGTEEADGMKDGEVRSEDLDFAVWVVWGRCAVA